MKVMTDRELTNKIGQVFDNFQDPSAEHGWRELRKKYPEPNRKPVLLWWGAAAVLLLVCGLWFIMPDISVDVQQIAEEKSGVQINKGNNDNGMEKAPPVNISSSRSTDYANNLNGSGHSQSRFDMPASALTSSTKQKVATLIIPSPSAVHISAENSAGKTPLISLPEPGQSTLVIKNHPEVMRDSLIDATAKMLALAQANPAKDPHLHPVDELGYASQKTSTQNQAFSFYAASFINYSLGSETKLNFGAGFTSDIKLSSKLKLSTGLALANNSLTYNNGVPSSGKEKLVFDVLTSFGMRNNNLTTITKYDASLLVLDIPINIKYLLIPKDNKLYLLAGLSSGTYLSETYSLNYRNYSAAGAYVNQIQGIDVKRQLRHFDFARILNISFGYSANLGKTQNITIEPFLKYPLSGLGSEDLKFGSTGVNLKLNFSTLKNDE